MNRFEIYISEAQREKEFRKKLKSVREELEYLELVINIEKLLLERRLSNKAGFNPNQPRVPAGSGDESGQWTDGDSGGGGSGNSGSGGRVKNPIPARGKNPIDGEVLLDTMLTVMPVGGAYRAWRVYRKISAARKLASGWHLGKFKSAKRWGNQLHSRGWTPEQITTTIRKGKQFSAPNMVNPANKAIRYQIRDKNGNKRYIVRDEVTKEILQISGKKFKKPIK